MGEQSLYCRPLLQTGRGQNCMQGSGCCVLDCEVALGRQMLAMEGLEVQTVGEQSLYCNLCRQEGHVLGKKLCWDISQLLVGQVAQTGEAAHLLQHLLHSWRQLLPAPVQGCLPGCSGCCQCGPRQFCKLALTEEEWAVKPALGKVRCWGLSPGVTGCSGCNPL